MREVFFIRTVAEAVTVMATVLVTIATVTVSGEGVACLKSA